ncbi:lysophospholipid acyltransferase family protein [Aeromicrobium piscarium]|uniref:1-acyl-sn-glycerol-3-phosphate acyltransferase n=1 Tax=Aeromicrobium piscarium TaxID=2590901 RepID=A0A554RVR1_9ACTN|nr:lysophospholipid acyltransferase family protein [Aeromicrobium piscarium]TSD58191.1 1-acyl-sn-glycerol-3-phosphate acyltransferase [Aeromicrobium piscarium]
MAARSMPRTLRVVVWILRPLLMVLTKRDWRGAERLPEPGYVIAANHLSWTDPVLLGHWMVDHGIVPRYLAKDPLFRVPVLRRILLNTQQIPVYRGTEGAAESMRAAVDAVAAGGIVTIYPEGTMTRDPEVWPMSGRTGAVRVALATGRPLVPIVQWGPQDILFPYDKRLRLFPRRTYRVLVGEPVDLDDLGADPNEAQIVAATGRLMDALTDLLAEVRGERPTGPRIDIHTLGAPRTGYRPEEER